MLLIILAIIGNRQRKRSANRVRQLVLACALFDPSGRVMVSPEGLLPTRKITNRYVERVSTLYFLALLVLPLIISPRNSKSSITPPNSVLYRPLQTMDLAELTQLLSGRFVPPATGRH